MKQQMMRLNIYVLILIIIFNLNSSILNAQGNPHYWSDDLGNRSNAAASKDGLMPIQKLEGSPRKVEVGPTGSFTLDVPLMTVPGRGGLNFDVKLQYTPGITVTQEASWVGLGWDLNPGSVIRNVMGYPDNFITGRKVQDPQKGDFVDDDYVRDIYSINLGDQGGKALQYPDPEDSTRYMLQMEEWKAWKIQYDTSNGRHRFVVVKEDGTIYVFGCCLAGTTSNAILPLGYHALQYPWYEPILEWKLTAIYYAPGKAWINNISDLPDDPSTDPNWATQSNWIAFRYGYDENYNKALFYYSSKNTQPGTNIKLFEVTYPRFIITPTHVAEFVTENEDFNPIAQLLNTNFQPSDDYLQYVSLRQSTWKSYFYSLRYSPTRSVKRRLKTIKLYRNTYPNGLIIADVDTSQLGTPIREIDLDYMRQEDFDTLAQYCEERTMLKSVSIKAGADSLPPYQFTYHDVMTPLKNGVFGGQYPYNPSDQTYYDYEKAFDPSFLNGSLGGGENIYIGMNGWYNSRDTNFCDKEFNRRKIVYGNEDDGKQWNLKTVAYPTGVVQQFDYESNHFAVDFTYRGKYTPDTNGFGGITWGLGSRLISQSIGSNIYEYSYGTSTVGDPNNFQDVGRMFADQFELQDIYRYNDYPNFPSDNIFCDTSTIFPPKFSPLYQQINHPVLYERVIEQQPDSSKIISYYQVAKLDEDLRKDLDNYYDNHQGRFNRSFEKRGNLIKREYVDSINQVAKRETFNTDEFPRLCYQTGGSGTLAWQSVHQTRQEIITESNIDHTTGVGVISIEEHKKNIINGLDSETTLYDSTTSGRNPLQTTTINYVFQPGNNTHIDPTTANDLLESNRLTEISETIVQNPNGDTLSNKKVGYWIGDKLPHDYYDNTVLVRHAEYDIYPNIYWQMNADGYRTYTRWGYNHSIPLATASDLLSTSQLTPLFIYEDFDPENFDHAWNLAGNYELSDGVLHLGNSSSTGTLMRSDYRVIDNIETQFEIKINSTTANSFAGFVFKAPGNDAVQGLAGYCIGIDGNNHVLLDKAGGTLIQATLGSAPDSSRVIKISIENNNFKIYVDGELEIDYTDNGVVPTGTYFGLFASNIDCAFDNLRIYRKGALCTTISYDPYTLNVISTTDENNNTTHFSYDNFGRLKQQIAPTGELLRDYGYFYHNEWAVEWISDTFNLVMADLYRSDKEINHYCFYFDDWGDKIQQQQYLYQPDIFREHTSIITHTFYDNMRRVMQTVKPYSREEQACNVLPAHPHKAPILSMKSNSKIGKPTLMSLYPSASFSYDYDPIGSSSYYYNSKVYKEWQNDWTPNSSYEYLHDATNRISAVYPPGDAFQSNPIRYQYSYNTDDDSTGYQPQQLAKTITTNENGVRNIQYQDILGNTVMTVTDADSLKLTTKFVYDANGKLLKSTPPNGGNFASTYTYDFRERLASKTSPDAGKMEYLYDKNNNIRLIKDENHRGIANNVSLMDTFQLTYKKSGKKLIPSFPTAKFDTLPPLTRPGYVYLTIQQARAADTVKYFVRTLDGLKTILFQGTITDANPYAASMVLPKGNYYISFSRNTSIDSTKSKWYITIKTSGGYEFVYHKYDGLNRLIEEGEYDSQDAVNHFTQQNAESITFPDANTVPVKQFVYDTLSADPLASGARNLAGKLVAAKSYRFGSLVEQTYYSYDSYGRAEWIAHSTNGMFPVKIFYTYDRQGNVLKKVLMNMNPYAGPLPTFYYSYDDFGRLDTVRSQVSKNPPDATYEYFASGKVKRMVLGGVQGMDYRYNERDWLEYINDPNPNGYDPGNDGHASVQPAKTGTKIPSIMKNVKRSNTKSAIPRVAEEYIPSKIPTAQKVKPTIADRFAMQLVYDGAFEGGMSPPAGNQPQYNGNISSIIYRYDSVYQRGTYVDADSESVVDSSDVVAYNYTYDRANRLIDDSFNWYSPGSNAFIPTSAYREAMSYDLNGNITQLIRNTNSGIATPINNQYIPNTNKLLIFGNGSAQSNISIYRYDGNGSMTSDPNAGINFVIYDCNNMPLAEYKGNTRYDYVYDANGTRISKTVGKNTTYYTQGVSGNAEMETIVGASTTSRYYIWGLDHLGHITSAMHYYYLKDHLGSIRMTVNKNGKVVSYDDYYPYGLIMPMRSKNMAMADERYKFIGNELDAETGYGWFGIRPYNFLTGEFTSSDLHAGSHPELSPYIYCGDNPIAFVDPTGKDSIQAQQLNKVLEKTHQDYYNDTKEHKCSKITIDAVEQYASQQKFNVPIDLLANEKGDAAQANVAISSMNTSGNWVVDAGLDAAIKAAGNGALVIAAYYGVGESGHIDVVGAGIGPYSGTYGEQNAICLGTSWCSLKLDWQDKTDPKNSDTNGGVISKSFGTCQPTFFIYKGFTPRPNP